MHEKRSRAQYLAPLLILVFLLSATGAFSLDGSSGISSNAEEGVFPQGRLYWFAVGEGDEIRLFIDGTEVYRGKGPSSVELDTPQGSERFFDLRAERRGLWGRGALVESRRWSVLIDRSPPAVPEISVHKFRDDTRRLSVAAVADTRVMALVDASGFPETPVELGEETLLPPGSFSLIAWAVDSAGNESDPLVLGDNDWKLDIINPVPGLWANRQTLYIETSDLEDVRWSIDGSDPSQGDGRPWSGPVFLDRSGTVFLRVSARTRAGELVYRELRYTVSETQESELSFLKALELSRGIWDRLDIPAGYRFDWASALEPAGSSSAWAPRHSPPIQTGSISLPPEESLQRRECLIVGKDAALWRFVLPLGGYIAETEELSGFEGAPYGDEESGSPYHWEEGEQGIPAPRLIRSGRCRLLLWPAFSVIHHRLGPEGPWLRSRRILSLPSQGGALEWFSDVRGSTDIKRMVIEPLAFQDSKLEALVDGRTNGRESIIISHPHSDGESLLPLSLSLSSLGPGDTSRRERQLVLSPGQSLTVAAADGEELELSARVGAAEPFGRWVIDRRPPPSPLYEGPSNGAWLEGAATLSLASEYPLAGSLSSSIEGGKHREYELENGSILFEPDNFGPRTISLRVWAVDEAGNRSAEVQRSFTVDTSTVYLDSSYPTPSISDGSRLRPATRLSEALEILHRLGRRRIALKGDQAAKELLSIDLSSFPAQEGSLPLVWIEGGYTDGWEKVARPSIIRFEEGSGIQLRNARLQLTDLYLQGPESGGAPLIALDSSTALILLRSRLEAAGPLIDAQDISLDARFSILSSRSQALRLRDSRVRLTDCIIGVDGGVPGSAVLDLSSGSLDAERLRVTSADNAFSLGLRLKDVEARISESGFRTASADLAIVLESEGGSLVLSSSEIQGQARDVVLLKISNTAASIEDCRLESLSTGVSRAFELSGSFPLVRGNHIAHKGRSLRSELFSGTEPRPSSVIGNRFISWRYLWQNLHGQEDLPVFNRRYAREDQRNSLEYPISGSSGDE